MIELRAEPVSPFRSEHAEGPMWADGRLFWVDQYRGIVRVAAPGPAGGDAAEEAGEADDAPGAFEVEETWVFDGPTGAVVPHSAGGWAVSADDAVWHVRDDRTRERIASVPMVASDGTELPLRMNDAKADPLGRFWIGTMAVGKEPGTGALHVLERGRLTTALDGLSIANGLVWDPAGRLMHYIDTPTQEVRRYRVHDTPDGPRPVDDGVAVHIDLATGEPDGMTIDRDGGLWVALWNGSAVHRYSPDGELIAIVHVDAAQVSSCVFGGPGLSTLFITTSQEDFTAERSAAEPGAGLVYSVDLSPLGFAGRPADAYRGS